ncbi:MAG: hypothetical protein FIB02_07465 [Desulfuromonas sp.]|nr:hypothetical protein [Desulfuromonas sp.]
MKRIMKYDWDAVVGVTAAFVAILMHFLHIVEAEVLLTIAVVLIAMLFLRDLRRENVNERHNLEVQQIRSDVKDILARISLSDTHLIGPQHIHQAMEDFCRRARNEMLWFHVCPLMFRQQAVFDAMFKPVIENPRVTSVQFVLDHKDRELWDSEVLPKIRQCTGCVKVRETHWTTISGGVSAIIADIDKDGSKECLLSFWGEPFMARTPSHDVPRYVFHVHSHSELVGRMVEVVRQHKLST